MLARVTQEALYLILAWVFPVLAILFLQFISNSYAEWFIINPEIFLIEIIIAFLVSGILKDTVHTEIYKVAIFTTATFAPTLVLFYKNLRLGDGENYSPSNTVSFIFDLFNEGSLSPQTLELALITLCLGLTGYLLFSLYHYFHHRKLRHSVTVLHFLSIFSLTLYIIINAIGFINLKPDTIHFVSIASLILFLCIMALLILWLSKRITSRILVTSAPH